MSPPAYAKDPAFVSAFLDEARMAGRIRHPNVIPTLDVVAANGELMLVMEYVQGESLARLIRRCAERDERIPLPIVTAILAGVLHGLHAAHEATDEQGRRLELVHRDVSPQNVLVGADGVARVLDFGIAKAAGRAQNTSQPTLKGKLAYMPPEQARCGEITRRADIYAAGILLWEALTLERLFEADSEVALLSRVLSMPIAPPSSVAGGLPAALDEIALRALSRDPDARFATAREMASALEACAPVASPTAVAAWVAHVASDALAQRAAAVANIERTEIVTPPRPTSRPRASVPPSRKSEHEVLVDLPANVAPATAYKSTWVISSLGALRDRGHLDAYFRKLPKKNHNAIRSMVSGVWLPLSIVRAHYLACQALELHQAEEIALGRAVSDRAQGTFLTTSVRMARSTDVTPWSILPQYDKLFHRGVEGGAVRVVKTGPKEAIIDIVKFELLDIPYFRTAFCGVLNGINGMFCRSSLVRELAHPAPDEATYRFQWA